MLQRLLAMIVANKTHFGTHILTISLAYSLLRTVLTRAVKLLICFSSIHYDHLSFFIFKNSIYVLIYIKDKYKVPCVFLNAFLSLCIEMNRALLSTCNSFSTRTTLYSKFYSFSALCGLLILDEENIFM